MCVCACVCVCVCVSVSVCVWGEGHVCVCGGGGGACAAIVSISSSSSSVVVAAELVVWLQRRAQSISFIAISTRAMERAVEQATGGGAPQPAESTADPRHANDEGAAPANDQGAAQMLALPSVCTFQEMQQMQPVQGIGGKVACKKQRDLRQVCLQTGVFEIDVTETWPEWRAVLRALPPNMQQQIIGKGIAQVKFRLLEGVRDSNYAKIDSGERHVFEILRVDTSAVHLHYHKNGSLDDPKVMPQNANSGASQPTAPFFAPSPSQPVIGRREAVLALTFLLNECFNNTAGAVDITDGHAFDWKRFVANTMENLQIAAMQLEKVFALRTETFGYPKLAFCTTCTTWKMLDPTQTHYKNTRLPGLQDMWSNWRENELFLQARTLGTNWLRMR